MTKLTQLERCTCVLGMLPGKRDEIRTLLRNYVGARVEAVRSNKTTEGIRRSENIQNELWAQAEAIADKKPNSIVVGLFVQSLNQMIDLHAERVQASLRSRIPDAIWVSLFAVAGLSLAVMGYHAGMVGTRRSLAIVAVAFTFYVVIELIAGLDRPQEGILKVSQPVLLDLQQSNESVAPAVSPHRLSSL